MSAARWSGPPVICLMNTVWHGPRELHERLKIHALTSTAPTGKSPRVSVVTTPFASHWPTGAPDMDLTGAATATAPPGGTTAGVISIRATVASTAPAIVRDRRTFR